MVWAGLFLEDYFMKKWFKVPAVTQPKEETIGEEESTSTSNKDQKDRRIMN